MSTESQPSSQILKYGQKIIMRPPKYEYIHTVNSTKISGEQFTLIQSNNKQLFELSLEIPAEHVKANSECVLFTCNENRDYHIDIEYTHSSCTTLLFDVSSNCRIFLYTKGESDFVSEQIHIYSKENAIAQLFCIQNVSASTTYLSTKKSYVRSHTSIDIFDVQIGGNYVQSEIISELSAFARSVMQQLYVTKSTQQHNLYVCARHLGEQSHSSILTRGIVTQSGHALSRGLIYIGQNASGSEGYEKQEVLLLSNNAEADAIPNLEIHNHDVKCSHGSTIGRLDEEKLTYLQMRGLSPEQAQRLLIHAYFLPIIDKLEGSVQKMIQSAIENAF